MTDGEQSGSRARRIFAEDLATELDVDMSPEYMDAVDKLLARLYLSGYIVVPVEAGGGGQDNYRTV